MLRVLARGQRRRTSCTACGSGGALSSRLAPEPIFAQEGVFEFGAQGTGDRALQLVLSSVDCNAGSLRAGSRQPAVSEINSYYKTALYIVPAASAFGWVSDRRH